MVSSTHHVEPNQSYHTAILTMLVLGGQVCFPIMLLFIFVSRQSMSRNSLFLHFCFTWIVHSVGFSILFYSGNVTGPEPAFIPCIIQGVLIFMAPVTEAAFLCALVYHLCSAMDSVLNSKARQSKTRMMILTAGPYLVSLVPGFATCVVAMNRPELVFRGELYYCSVSFRPLSYITSTLSGIFLSTSVFLQGRIAYMLYKNRLVLKQVTVQGFELLHLFVRLSFFTFFTVIGVAMALVMIVDGSIKARIVFQAALPLLAFLTFGTRLSFYRLGEQKEQPTEGNEPLTAESSKQRTLSL